MADGSRHVVAPAALAHASRGAESRSGSPAIPRLRRSSALSEGPRNGAKIVSRESDFCVRSFGKRCHYAAAARQADRRAVKFGSTNTNWGRMGSWARHEFRASGAQDGEDATGGSGVAGPLPPDLVALASDVVADLDGVEPLGMTLEYEPIDEPAGAGRVKVTVGGCSYGFGIFLPAPEAEILLALADGIQEHLPECREAWGQARPECPGHAHPAAARVVANTAYWTCPTDARRLARVGELHKKAGPSLS
jgi:hypothetical protein